MMLIEIFCNVVELAFNKNKNDQNSHQEADILYIYFKLLKNNTKIVVR